MNYEDYVTLFNTGDDAALVERFFAEDCALISASRISRGKGELLAFLGWAHDGVREIARPQRVLQDENSILAEVDMDFIATGARPGFPFGELFPGDILTVKFLVAYTIRNGRIVELKSMTWPAERGVTKAPMLGAGPGQRAAYLAYASAFSHGDMDRAGRFYTDDCVLELPTLEIAGRQAIVDFYRAMFARVREQLTLHSVVADDDGIAVDVTSTFTAIEDAPDFVVAPLRKGEEVSVPLFVHYALRGGRICRIKGVRAGPPEISAQRTA
ncbi:MAG: nuclear transport factor 2 family protein [Sphingomonadales bacterium]